MTDLQSSNHPVKPTKENYEKGRSLWGQACGVTQGVQKVLDYGLKEGADQELDACCAWLEKHGRPMSSEVLRKSRRPTLKVRALEALNEAVRKGESFTSSEATKIIRQALEELNG